MKANSSNKCDGISPKNDKLIYVKTLELCFIRQYEDIFVYKCELAVAGSQPGPAQGFFLVNRRVLFVCLLLLLVGGSGSGFLHTVWSLTVHLFIFPGQVVTHRPP